MAKHARRWSIGLGFGAVVAFSVLAGLAFAARQVAPTNVTEPRIEGQPRVGVRLVATTGTWSGTPTVYRYQWLRCPESGGRPDGADCAVLPEATNFNYVVRQADAGRRLRVRVTASNAHGSGTATSNATARVQSPAATRPVNTSPPTISGTPVVGSTLTVNPGAWTGRPTFTYQWRRCNEVGGGCADITGATTGAYVTGSADRGNTLRVRVTAHSGNLTASATSVPTAVIRAAATPPPPPRTGCPPGTDTIRIEQLSPPARLLISGQQLSPPVVTGSTGALTVRLRVTACGGRPVSGALVYAAAVPFNQFTPQEQATGADGWATLTMTRLRGFPANPGNQQLLVMLARARKGGENLLGGISSRRLISFPVNL